MGGWERREPLVSTAADCGGDVQVSAAFDARWCRRLGDGTWALVTRAFYVADDGRRRMECQTEYLICLDVDEPGGTERWSDYRHTTVPGVLSDDGVRRAAEEAVAPTDDEWAAVAPGWAVTS